MTNHLLLPTVYVAVDVALKRYHWRKPYTGMTEAEIVEHIIAARQFAFSDGEPISECISGGSPCCLSWAATKLETDFLFAGIDEASQSIEVLGPSLSLTCMSCCRQSSRQGFFIEARQSGCYLSSSCDSCSAYACIQSVCLGRSCVTYKKCDDGAYSAISRGRGAFWRACKRDKRNNQD